MERFTTPVVFYDKEGNPVYGTECSKKMYQQSFTKAGLREVKNNALEY
jgi:hypothetical protein